MRFALESAALHELSRLSIRASSLMLASALLLALDGCHSTASAAAASGTVDDHASRGAQSDAPAPPCATDGDCVVQRCAGCRCISLRRGQPPPASCGLAICAADPCGGSTAACDPATHTCRLQRSSDAGASPSMGSVTPAGGITAGYNCGGAAGARCPAGQSCVFGFGSDGGHCQRNGLLGTRCEAAGGCDPGLACAHDEELVDTGQCRTPGSPGTPCGAGSAPCSSGTTCTPSPDGGTSLCRRPGQTWTACDASGAPGHRCQAWTTCVLGGASAGRCRDLPRQGGPCGTGVCAPNEVCCDRSHGPCVRGPLYTCP